ncbi:MAG: helix-turn-helix domain-containing protein [Anaerotignaceae bacterium]
MFEKFDDIVDVATICKMLKIGKTSAYELVKENKIKSFKIRNKILIAKIDVINFVESERSTA